MYVVHGAVYPGQQSIDRTGSIYAFGRLIWTCPSFLLIIRWHQSTHIHDNCGKSCLYSLGFSVTQVQSVQRLKRSFSLVRRPMTTRLDQEHQDRTVHFYLGVI